jgi:hypothetical protein
MLFSSMFAIVGCGRTEALVDSPQVVCEITATGRIDGPRKELCQHLADRYATLIDTLPMAGVVRVSNETLFRSHDGRDSAWGMDWPGSQLYPEGLKASYDSGATETFFHEIGHSWLSPHMSGGRQISIGDRYGTEAPDWLDEAWAMWAPFQVHRQNRARRLEQGITPSLRMLVTMPHPVNGAGVRKEEPDDVNDPIISRSNSRSTPCPACTWLPDSVRTRYRYESIRLRESGKVDTILQLYDSMPPEMATRSLEEERFYPLSYSLLRYIRETGGTAAVRELIARYRVDPTPRAEALVNLPGMPATIDALEAGWHAFINERRPEPK